MNNFIGMKFYILEKPEVYILKSKLFIVIFSIAFVVTGCSNDTNYVLHANKNEQYISVHESPKVGFYNSENVEAITKTDLVYTTARKLSLTFNGLPDQQKLEKVLNLLDHYNIKATFFVPGLKAAVEPKLLEMIQRKGHEIESNTLSKVKMDTYTYNEIVDDIVLSKQTIEATLGKGVKYVRAEPTTFIEPILKAATKSEYERYIGYSLFLTDEYLTTMFTHSDDFRSFIKRGAIIAIDLERNEQIEKMLQLLIPAVKEVNYEFVKIDELLSNELNKLAYPEIYGFDLAQTNEVSADQTFELFDHVNTNKKQIALTFDDWGTDYTVTNMLDILKAKNVKATFFIRADGAERNPALARAIIEDGHEVANHSYSHPIITDISSAALQDEIVHAHQVLTEALQQAPTMYFRPPTGHTNIKTAKIVAATGYSTLPLFNIDPNDWNEQSSSEDIVNTITNEAVNGGIVLLHMLDNTHTLQALPIVIDKLQEMGYEIVTITEMLHSK